MCLKFAVLVRRIQQMRVPWPLETYFYKKKNVLYNKQLKTIICKH